MRRTWLLLTTCATITTCGSAGLPSSLPQPAPPSTMPPLTPAPPGHGVELVLPCSPSTFESTLSWLTDEGYDEATASHPRIGFRMHAIFPADDPTTAVLYHRGGGAAVRLERVSGEGPEDQATDASGMTLRLPGDYDMHDEGGRFGRTATAVGPNQLVVRFTSKDLMDMGDGCDDEHANRDCEVPFLLVSRPTADDETVAGRAGMRYRDLIPGRLGGKVICSQITIPDGGPVPDYVHYHHVCTSTSITLLVSFVLSFHVLVHDTSIATRRCSFK